MRWCAPYSASSSLDKRVSWLKCSSTHDATSLSSSIESISSELTGTSCSAKAAVTRAAGDESIANATACVPYRIGKERKLLLLSNVDRVVDPLYFYDTIWLDPQSMRYRSNRIWLAEVLSAIIG